MQALILAPRVRKFNLEDMTDVVILRGKIAVAAINLHRTRIYALDQDSRDHPETVPTKLILTRIGNCSVNPSMIQIFYFAHQRDG